MKISPVFIIFALTAMNVNAQHDPYGRIDTKNLGNINQQDYEIAVLSTFRQNVPHTGMNIDLKNYNNIGIHNIEDYRTSVLSTFDRHDIDRDGRISREEFSKVDGMDSSADFNIVDADKDGYISHDELLKAMPDNSQASGRNKAASKKSAKQKQEEAHPSVRVEYDEILGYYVK